MKSEAGPAARSTRAELLIVARPDVRAITPELTGEIDRLAQAYVTAGTKAEEAADKMKWLAEAGTRGAQMMSDAFMSVLDGSMSAGDALKTLLLEIANAQFQKKY